jgi:excisionase family DNA binding protein
MPLRRAAGAGDHASDDSPIRYQPGAGRAGPRHHSRERISFFTVSDVAGHLGVSTRTVRRWIEGRQLIAHHFGRAVRVAEEDLRTFLRAHRGE